MTDSIDDLYHEALLDEVKNPFHRGELDQADLVLHGLNASCGDVLTLYLTFRDHNLESEIEDISWSGHGCAISQAAASKVARLILDKHLNRRQAASLTQLDIEKELGLSNLSVNRIKCALLAVNTLKQER